MNDAHTQRSNDNNITFQPFLYFSFFFFCVRFLFLIIFFFFFFLYSRAGNTHTTARTSPRAHRGCSHTVAAIPRTLPLHRYFLFFSFHFFCFLSSLFGLFRFILFVQHPNQTPQHLFFFLSPPFHEPLQKKKKYFLKLT